VSAPLSQNTVTSSSGSSAVGSSDVGSSDVGSSVVDASQEHAAMKGSPTPGRVVAIVATKDRADSIVATVSALLESAHIDEVVVVDDGSRDLTASVVREFAQRREREQRDGDANRVHVLRLPENVGKGGAVAAGVASCSDASVFVFIDADLGNTATIADELLEPVLHNEADMTIGVPTTAAGTRGGFGFVKNLAASGIQRACGFAAQAPLSGQRAIRREVLNRISLADRFGLETAMTIDARRADFRVLEVPVSFEHRHTGRRFAGFRHRAGQGLDIVRALWSRLTTTRFRAVLMIVLAFLCTAGALATSGYWEPSHVAGARKASKVLFFGFPRLSLTDLDNGSVPTVDRLIEKGALGATSVRTIGGRPTTVEAYASIGAGTRVRARDGAADAFAAGDQVGSVTAAELATVRTGREVDGDIVVTGMAEAILGNAGRYLSSQPGALGDSLREARKRTAVVNSSDTALNGDETSVGRQRPAAIAIADSGGVVRTGVVGSRLLRPEPKAPTGATVNVDAFLAATVAALDVADVVVLDPGEMDRTFAVKVETDERQFETLRMRALGITDDLLAKVVASVDENTLIIVSSVRPPTGTWELTPTVIYGAGISHGYLHSPSTNRLGLVTLTDLAPTMLDALGLPVRDGMIGHALQVHRVNGATDIGRLKNVSTLASYRERIYLPLTKGYVIFQAIVYLLTIVLFSARGGVGRIRGALSWIVLAIAAWPLATFVFRMIPHAWVLGAFGGLVMLGIDLVIVWGARRSRRHALSPLSWILFLTVAVNVVDLWTGAHLQQSSILGYSPHTAARFTGIGNAAFAALAATTILWAGIHVHFAPRRREATLAASLVCLSVLVADGAPSLGADVGGILTLVPVFGLLLWVLWGYRLSLRSFLIAGGATLALLAVATGVDLTRPADQRTHLGRFVSDIVGGKSDTFTTTIGRKLATNVRVFTGSFWTWVVPIIAIVLLFFLVVQRGWERDMPRGSALRACVAAALLCGLLGFAVNDSGTVVTALVFVYLGPFITLLALRRSDDPLPGVQSTSS
jgi:hypothetical protein